MAKCGISMRKKTNASIIRQGNWSGYQTGGYQQYAPPLENTMAYNFFVNNQNPAKFLKDAEINNIQYLKKKLLDFGY